MRFLSTLIVIGGLCYGAYWLNQTRPDLKYKAFEMINTDTFDTLESRFTATQIMERERLTLLPTADYRYIESSVSYHPYLLMEVKFTNAKLETEEGVILWDLIDGEMVRNTSSWDKTHGFADCINSGADQYEYKILEAIANNDGKADKQTLIRSLSIEPRQFEAHIERARKKKLVVLHGDDYQIHLHHPVINVQPSTSINQPLVTKTCRCSQQIARHYSSSQIKKATEAAFGSDFAIRSTREVFLPIYSITVQSPDGSLHTTQWNALNGKQFAHSNLIE